LRGREPLAQLDRIAVRVADLRARVSRLLHRPPRRIDAARLELGERRVHVFDLEREALPAEAPLIGARRDGAAGFGICHDLERRVAEFEINEIERPIRRARYAGSFAHAEAERPGIEIECALRIRSEELDVVDALEHRYSGLMLAARITRAHLSISRLM